MTSYTISVAKDYLGFCSAHFITYAGHRCEALHGHNYRVQASLEGTLDENAYVFDFVTLKQILRRLCDALDHRVLLPLENPLLDLRYDEQEVHVQYKERRYLFPRQDTVLLPIKNTTAEQLASYLCGQLIGELQAQGVGNLSAVAIEVEEAIGQSAHYREEYRHER